MELKPCPFCGGEANIVEASLATKVVCVGCGAETGYHYGLAFGSDCMKNAIEHWNKRAETATDVLRAIDQLRRDLSGYHGQLKAHDDLKRHCDNQRRRIAELEAIHARDAAEIAELKEQTRWIAQTDSRWEAAVRDLEQAKAENEKLRELVDELYPLADYGAMDASELDTAHDLMRELGVEV